MTEYEEENVLAMKTDERDEYLLCGDTVGMLAVFNIKGYCVAHEVLVITSCIGVPITLNTA